MASPDWEMWHAMKASFPAEPGILDLRVFSNPPPPRAFYPSITGGSIPAVNEAYPSSAPNGENAGSTQGGDLST